MERRRLTAHFFRCFHLLEIFLTEFIESGDIFKNPSLKKPLSNPEKVLHDLSKEKEDLFSKGKLTKYEQQPQSIDSHQVTHSVYFSFSRLSNILLKIGIDIEKFNENPHWMKHLEQMFADFGIQVIKFLIDFKTSTNLETFLTHYNRKSNIVKRSEVYGERFVLIGLMSDFDAQMLEKLEYYQTF